MSFFSSASMLLLISVVTSSSTQREKKSEPFFKTEGFLPGDKLKKLNKMYEEEEKLCMKEFRKEPSEGKTYCDVEMQYVQCVKKATHQIDAMWRSETKIDLKEMELATGKKLGLWLVYDEATCKRNAERFASRGGNHKCDFDCTRAMSPYDEDEDGEDTEDAAGSTADNDKDSVGTAESTHSGVTAHAFTVLSMLPILAF